MNMKLRVRIALIISVFAAYRAYEHVQRILAGCIDYGEHQRCSFENADNFEGWLNLDLLFTCGWIAAAVLCWIGIMQQPGKNPR
ncbi:hypothetical protein [Burkholderia alba]|uniref:hypothetical protein n=1 Tax=Burkholderia alba TaxID=2683677 RepID=UPI002B0565A6|nr:hypothetical protein [Burkholderia alba]